MHLRIFCVRTTVCLLFSGLLIDASAFAKRQPNVLFIAVDDLRPELGCYGANHIHSPNIDRLADGGMRFDRAYCQQAVCNPSRTSLMTGLRPDTIGVTGNHSHFRSNMPNVVTLPQHFKKNGYHAAAIGKLYHGVFPDGCSKTKWDTMGDPQSWSEPAIRFGPRYYYTEEGIEAAQATFQKIYQPKNPEPESWTKKLVFGLATEAPDVSDNTLYDGKVAEAAIRSLNEWQKGDSPFFLAVGFIKPHSPYVAPKKYFDLYNDVRIASTQSLPQGAPNYAGHGSGELRRYTDQPARGEISPDQQRRVRHAYFACVSYIDAQIGLILDELDRLGLAENTIVSLYGDHGYHLGEHGLWGKTTNFELDTRVPLIIRAPGMQATGRASSSLVELVDLYPTLAELAGLPIGDHLQGKSLAGLLDDPTATVKTAAISQYPRSGGLMGYSMRTATHRLTKWIHQPTGKVQATELYDYTAKNIEVRNTAIDAPEIVDQLSSQFTKLTQNRVIATSLKKPSSNLQSGRASFDESAAGPFKSLDTPVGQWTTRTGAALIDNQHAASGQNCLQLMGGKETTIELNIADGVRTDGRLTFRAERWTKRAPFRFRIEKQTDGRWTEIYNGDQQIRVGRPFLSNVNIPLNDDSIDRLRMTVISPPNTGILIDDLKIAPATPQKIVSVESIPLALPALVGRTSSQLVKLIIEVDGSLEPISLANVSAAAAGSDVESLSLQNGENIVAGDRSAERPSSSFSFSCSPTFCQLRDGTNEVLLTCTLIAAANIDHRVGAAFRRVTFSNGESFDLHQPVFMNQTGVAVRDAGDDGVHTYRIPGLATTKAGTLIGVYDVRRRSGGDLPGDIDVGMSRSKDGGRTWEPMKIIMDMGDDPAFRHDGIGDPTVLVDKNSGTIWCGATWSHGNRSWFGSQPGLAPVDTGQFMLVKSDDDGATWSKPINITKQVKKPEWSFLLQGPGKGITMSDGTLVMPAQYQDPPHANDKKANRLPHSTFIYSHDHGSTWQTATGAWDDTTESQVVELADGQIMINCRNNRLSRRAIMTTSDLGKTWQEHSSHNTALIEPGACMASVINVGRELRQLVLSGNHAQGNEFLLFSNPDSLQGRNHITIKASLDGGKTWPAKHHLLLDEKSGRGYSCLTMIDAETVGILYEGSQAHMTFQRVKLADILKPPKNQKTKNPAQVESATDNAAADARSQKDIAFARVFGNHMVLQADQPIRIWGQAKPGANVTVQLGPATTVTKAGTKGRWQVALPAQARNSTSQTLSATSGDITVVIQDVLMGEVWLCAGQSNMEWPLNKSDGGKEAVENSNDTQLRLMNFAGAARGGSGVYNAITLQQMTPERFSTGTWQTASPASSSNFSAVGYYFAKRLRKKLNCPVGIINVSIGGTPIEAWISSKSLREHPTLQQMVRSHWLHNPVLDEWCKSRAKSNLKRGLSGEFTIPGDEFGPNHSFKPGFMYDAGIKPFTPMSIKGTLWYQGESNGDNPERIHQYDAAFPVLVSSWRAAFQNARMPVVFVQLPAMKRPNWPLFREFQRRSLTRLHDVGMAITIDTGEPGNVHPAEKKTVGDRLAQWALAKTYGKHLPAMGPLYQSKKIQGESLVLTFETDGDTLITANEGTRPTRETDSRSVTGAAPNHFEVAGEDGIFHPAQAINFGHQVTVSSKQVPHPRHARYAWADFPDPKPNLFGASGLPASPFTTEKEVPDGSSDVTDDRPNILLIVSEDNGPELGCYGDPYAHTPNLDQLATEGVRFETAYVTQAVCSPSRGTIFTGLYPHQNGQIGLATHQFEMFKAWPTTYSILKEAGYRTGLLGKTHVNPANVIEDHVDYRAIRSSNFAKKDLAAYTERSAEFINASDRPFFLTVNYPDAHWPVQIQVQGRPQTLLSPNDVGPMPYIGFDNDRLRGHLTGFYNCMSRLDECVGELLQELAESGKADNTLVIYIGDHGAQFARGKVFVTEGGLRIPFIVRWPGNTKPGLVSPQMVSTVDLLPTIVGAAAATAPDGLPGKNLAPILNGSTQPIRDYLFGERNSDSADLHFPQRAIRDARYKLIRTLLSDRPDPGAQKCLKNGASNFRGSPTFEEIVTANPRTQKAYDTWYNTPEYQLYDLQNDRHEFKNLADNPKLSDIRQRLISRLDQWQVDTDDRLRFPELLAKLTEETDKCREQKIRSPKGGWQYINYLAP